jgi:hypothetical protein
MATPTASTLPQEQACATTTARTEPQLPLNVHQLHELTDHC